MIKSVHIIGFRSCADVRIENLGRFIALVGKNGAGKSTLARLMLGVWPTSRGAVRLDGANVYSWDREDFGKQVGYLPQSNDLLNGSIYELQ